MLLHVDSKSVPQGGSSTSAERSSLYSKGLYQHYCSCKDAKAATLKVQPTRAKPGGPMHAGFMHLLSNKKHASYGLHKHACLCAKC